MKKVVAWSLVCFLALIGVGLNSQETLQWKVVGFTATFGTMTMTKTSAGELPIYTTPPRTEVVISGATPVIDASGSPVYDLFGKPSLKEVPNCSRALVIDPNHPRFAELYEKYLVPFANEVNAMIAQTPVQCGQQGQ